MTNLSIDLFSEQFPDQKSPILVSACLLGINCTYKMTNNRNEKAISLLNFRKLIPICPEQLGGLSTPRNPNCIIKGTGFDVLEKKTLLIDIDNNDTSANFIKGAQESFKLAELFGVKYALLKEKSPSCGVRHVYNKISTKEKLINGPGVTSAFLLMKNIKVISELDL
ncbi:MAG: DUF523 domain-containing protein [Candidatus Heimdallarchaeota archaeon]|nr:DUF523 domain-containing protein [Candidatus Heimdallarchaeota archaeon]